MVNSANEKQNSFNKKAMPWLQRLDKAESVNTLRDELQANYPGIPVKNLKQIIIVGAADEGVRLANLCDQYGIKVLAFCDDHATKQGMKVGAHKVAPLDSIASQDKEIPVIIASHRVLKVTKRLQAMGFKNIAPFALLQAVDPSRFAPHMFYENWLEELFRSREKYHALTNLFADSQSNAVLDAVLGFRLTLNSDILSPIVEWELYGPNALLSYTDNEVYVDGGTFDGDTIRLFIDRVSNQFDRIIGFEPDPNTFVKLKSNFAHEPRVEPMNKGLYSHATTLFFDDAGTRGSIIKEDGKSGGISVPVTSIDEVLGLNGRVTYIKMNIEGAEIPALKGAKEAIKRCAPKLAISVYHRASDLWEIPFLVRELRNDYDLYLRQHDGGVIETVLYALKKG